MKKQILLSLAVITSFLLHSQTTYKIDVSNSEQKIIRGHLDLGGSNPDGDSISVNSFYIERNGKPFIPVIGEFHYSRYPNKYWDEQIKKIKAGGINVVATYIFWNLHEFKEGQFSWTDDLNLRRFVELCGKNGLEVIIRVGPFAHGEIRNGGLPDWLYGRPIEVRTNDPAYLFYANRFYHEIGKQLKGLMFKDGGPIIGTQIENEYQHSAAPWGFGYMDAPRERTVGRRDVKITQDGVGINTKGNEFANMGRDHMKTLKNLAVNAGLITPIYTATGWGRATIVEKGSIPVMAGYAYPFWSASNSASPFYLYKNIHKNPDYSPVSYDVDLYPSMAAELGTGMAVTYSRRPRVPGESFLPMMVRTVGSGTNGLGYYMYHGGTTPSIGNFFLSEGWGLNHKSYDYQAPIGEFGRASSGFYGLKFINYFLRDFGHDLAPLYPVLPEGSDTIKANNLNTLRYAVRSDGEKGYLFMHNYQDHLEAKTLDGLKIDIKTKSGEVKFPADGTFRLNAGSSAIFPINMVYDGVNVRQATLQPFSRFKNNGKSFNVFISIDGILPEMVLKGKLKITGKGFRTRISGDNTIVTFRQKQVCEMQVNGRDFLILPFEVAQNAYIIGDTNKFLVISNALVLEDNTKLTLITTRHDSVELNFYPTTGKINISTGIALKVSALHKSMSAWKIVLNEVKPDFELIQTDDRHFVLRAPNIDWTKINDVFITFNYRGDRALCMMNGELQTDDLYTSKPWTIGLKRYADALKMHEMYFHFIPMAKDAPYLSYLDINVIPDFGNTREFLEIKKPVTQVEYKFEVELK